MDAKLLAAMAAYVNIEERASRVYRQLSAWCEWQSWVGSAAFFRKEAAEEQQHTQEWQDYVLDRGGEVSMGQQDPISSGSAGEPLVECYAAALASEEAVLTFVQSLATQAAAAGEWDAVRFCQHYTEAGVKQIRDLSVYVARLKRLAGDADGIDRFDCEMGGK